jgi:hypothetical protein
MTARMPRNVSLHGQMSGGNPWDGLAPRLLHPDTVYSGREVLASLERLSIAGMGDGCHEETLKSLRLKGVFTRDADYVNEAVDELMRHQTD